jgi:hypothetical protein
MRGEREKGRTERVKKRGQFGGDGCEESGDVGNIRQASQLGFRCWDWGGVDEGGESSGEDESELHCVIIKNERL